MSHQPDGTVPGQDAVGAVVVTYHPDAQVLLNLAALRPQVGRLVVVDNASTPEALELLREAARRLDFSLLIQNENFGIATALNIGCRQLAAQGCEWLLLFDQDSTVGEGFTNAMLTCQEARTRLQQPGLMVPGYVDRRTGMPIPEARLADGTLATAMTSGTLLAADLFERLGPFAEDLFIDSVDHEYSLRVRASGRVIRSCAQARLLHSPGTPQPHRFLGRQFHSSNYGPLRRYYQERNKIWLYRHYGLRFPRFLLREFLRSFVDLAKVLLAEQDKTSKCMAIVAGVRDGLLNRMGKRNSRG